MKVNKINEDTKINRKKPNYETKLIYYMQCVL
jgi:hypothetical protein